VGSSDFTSQKIIFCFRTIFLALLFLPPGLAAARLDDPERVVLLANCVYAVSDANNNRILLVTRDDIVMTLACAQDSGFDDCVCHEARFDGPMGLAVWTWTAASLWLTWITMLCDG
jgi:hypothetical protein